MDRKLYLIRKFYFESLTDAEYQEFEEYALSDQKFRRMIVRGAKIKNIANEILGERIEDDPEFKKIVLEEEARKKRLQDGGEEEEIYSSSETPSEVVSNEEKALLSGEPSEGMEGEKRKTPGGARAFNRKVFIYIGAGIAAVAVIGLVIAVLLRPPLNERIYSKYFALAEVETYRSPRQSMQGSLLLPIYQDKDLGGIRAVADNPAILQKFNDLDYLLAGIAYMEAMNFQAADNMLSTIKEGSEQYHAAAWYLGLIRLYENQPAECMKYMRIAKESLIFNEKALKLIDELKGEVADP
jgi:hypothetical protein